MSQAVERRNGSSLELREQASGGVTLFGYAAIYGAEYRYWDVVETVKKGAFDTSISNRHDVIACVSHNTDQILSRVSANNLILRSDDKGLYFEAHAPDVSYVRDVIANIKAGNIAGCSFAFKVVKDSFTDLGDGKVKREIEDVVLYDVCVTPTPAYTATDVHLRSLNDRVHEQFKQTQIDRDRLNLHINLVTLGV